MKLLLNSPWKKVEFPKLNEWVINDIEWVDLKDAFIDMTLALNGYHADIINGRDSDYTKKTAQDAIKRITDHNTPHAISMEVMPDDIAKILRNPNVFMSILLTEDEVSQLKYRTGIVLYWLQKDTTLRDGDDEATVAYVMLFSPLRADTSTQHDTKSKGVQFERIELDDGSVLFTLLLIQMLDDNSDQYTLVKMPPADSAMVFPIGYPM